MLSTYETNALAKLRIQELVAERHLNREVRTEMPRRMAQQKLRRAVEKLLETDGGVRSVLDVINHVVDEIHVSDRQSVETPCCS